MTADPDPREVINRQLPELRVDAIEPLGDGWDHVAYLVNEEIVLRIPWELIEEEGGAADLPRAADAEVGLLRAVSGRIPVEVPEPVHVARDGSFFGYRYLPGRSVADALDDWTEPRRQQTLATLLVDVAVGIEEAVPVEEAQRIGLEPFATARHDPAQAAAALRRSIVPTPVRAAGEAVLATYEARWEAAAARRMATLHADFGLDHWLLDARGEVYALIDWSDACVAPPEHQLSTLMWDVPGLTAATAAGYMARTGVELDMELIVADACVNALGDLGELLDEGGSDDDPDVRRCLSVLAAWAGGIT